MKILMYLRVFKKKFLRSILLVLSLLAIMTVLFNLLAPSISIFPNYLDRTSLSSSRLCFSSDVELLSALNRTSSSYCRRRFHEAVCSTKAGDMFFPDHCPHKSSMTGSEVTHLQITHALGCFAVKRDIIYPTRFGGSSYVSDNLFTNQTVRDCVHWCQLSGLPYAYARATDPCICSCQLFPPTSSVSISPLLCRRSCTDITIECNTTIPVEVVSTATRVRHYRKISKFYWPQKEINVRPIRIVYLIICHGRSWLQLKRLFRLIYHNRHFYYIHVDSRSDYLYSKARELSHRFPNNVFLDFNRTATTWGGPGLLTMILRVLRELFSGSLRLWSWDFLINLSSADFPIRPHHQLIAYLTANRGKLFLKSVVDKQRYLLDQGFGKIFYECDGYVWYLGRRPLPEGIVIDGGSDWFVLPYDFLRYIALGQDSLIQSVIDYYKHSLLPVESFFHVLAQNSRFCDRVVNHHLRLINWQRPRGCECKQESVVDWCGCSPVALTGATSLQWLVCTVLDTCVGGQQPGRVATGDRREMVPVFFTRKIDSTIDLGLVNALETKLLGRSAMGNTWNYYLEEIFSRQDQYTDVPPAWSAYLPLLSRRLPSPFSLDSITGLKVFALFRANESANASHLFYHRRVSPPQLVFQLTSEAPQLNSSSSSGGGGGGPPLVHAVELLVDQPRLAYTAEISESNPMLVSPGEIVYLELSSMHDGKEQVFRNYPRLVTTADTLVLMLAWRGGHADTTDATAFHLSLQPSQRRLDAACHHLLRPPTSQVRSIGAQNVVLSFATRLTADLFPGCAPLKVGLWSIIAVSSHRGGGLSRPVTAQVLVLPVTPTADADSLLATVWRDVRPAAYCLTPSGSDSWPGAAGLLKSLEGPTAVVDCRQAAWSSLAPDAKSELDRCVNMATGQLAVEMGQCH